MPNLWRSKDFRCKIRPKLNTYDGLAVKMKGLTTSYDAQFRIDQKSTILPIFICKKRQKRQIYDAPKF